MERKLYCPYCSEEEYYTIERTKETYPVKGEDTEINALVTKCCNCGNEIWNEELDSQNIKQAYDAYRAKHKLLTSEQIKAIRDKYAISQSTFARALGLGEKTITRYERGSIQDRAHNGLILLAERPDAFKCLVELNDELLTEAEIRFLQAKIDQYRVRVIERKSASTTMSYINRSSFIIKSKYNYFGGLNDAG